MAHYELYICLTKAVYESAVPSVLQPKLGWNNYTYEADGETTTAYTPTWKEAAFKGKLSAPRESLDGGLVIVKGEFSLLQGELTAIVALGNGLAYPNNSVLTKTEAQTLVKGELFTE
jgi:predicted 2-oxoglutarate/Fe(II)-dependent dioxygenase YbiX